MTAWQFQKGVLSQPKGIVKRRNEQARILTARFISVFFCGKSADLMNGGFVLGL
jgi:hypothetical protein